MRNDVILITGCAGFVGFHLAKKFIELGHTVIGIDSLDDYYDVDLKKARLKILSDFENFSLHVEKLENERAICQIVQNNNITHIVHLAAQAGVRHSIEKPRSYFDSNLLGTFNLLEAIKELKINHFMMASTSSVYGNSEDFPLTESSSTDFPISLYAATKKSTEILSHSYSHVYQLPVTAFRFFTVYGPWGRPDMALFKFTKNILLEKPIEVFNYGEMRRDFTYIDDLVNCIVKLKDKAPLMSKSLNKLPHDSTDAPWRSINIGGANSVRLMDFINIIEQTLGKKAIINFKEMQMGDVKETLADNEKLKNLIGDHDFTDITVGISKFISWYLSYHNTNSGDII